MKNQVYWCACFDSDCQCKARCHGRLKSASLVSDMCIYMKCYTYSIYFLYVVYIYIFYIYLYYIHYDIYNIIYIYIYCMYNIYATLMIYEIPCIAL